VFKGSETGGLDQCLARKKEAVLSQGARGREKTPGPGRARAVGKKSRRAGLEIGPRACEKPSKRGRERKGRRVLDL